MVQCLGKMAVNILECMKKIRSKDKELLSGQMADHTPVTGIKDYNMGRGFI